MDQEDMVDHQAEDHQEEDQADQEAQEAHGEKDISQAMAMDLPCFSRLK